MANTDNALPENSKESLDRKLDHAIEETFPTSDPVSVTITKGGAVDYDRQEAAPSDSSSEETQRMAEALLHKARDTIQAAASSASETTREAYKQGQRYARQAAKRYPEAERFYREGSRVVGSRIAQSPLLSILLAGAAGYALAWMIHGNSPRRDERVADYARTKRGYAPHRSEMGR
jgi:hypothetical protein